MDLNVNVDVDVGAIGEAGRDYAQDVRYFAKEHMDVRCEAPQLRTALKSVRPSNQQ